MVMVTGYPRGRTTERHPGAAAWVPGTWGELVQGTVDGEDLLLTCPVNLYTLAVAHPDDAAAPAQQGWRTQRNRHRTRLVLAQMPGSGRVRIHSPLRPGAGMASSTADLAAAMAAVLAAQGDAPAPQKLFHRCLQHEPTDGLMLPGIALVNHRQGTRVENWGPPPPLAILGVDPGGSVSTERFNGRQDLAGANWKKEPLVREALRIAKAALAAQDPAGLALAATLSAQAHQAILPNPVWDKAWNLSRRCGALGLNVAHSGVVIGFLFDARRADLPAVGAWLANQLQLPVRHLRLVSGGVQVQARG